MNASPHGTATLICTHVPKASTWAEERIRQEKDGIEHCRRCRTASGTWISRATNGLDLLLVIVAIVSGTWMLETRSLGVKPTLRLCIIDRRAWYSESLPHECHRAVMQVSNG